LSFENFLQDKLDYFTECEQPERRECEDLIAELRVMNRRAQQAIDSSNQILRQL
jgi:hypothetical protein